MRKLNRLLVYEWHGWSGYLISHLVAESCRREAGYGDAASIFDGITGADYDAVLFQVDLSDSSVFPRQRRAMLRTLARNGVPVLNAGIADIRKRHLHALLAGVGLAHAGADENGDPDEMLFIKTNLNYGGEPEQKLMDAGLAEIPAADAAWRRHIDAADRYYRARRGEIDAGQWRDPHLVIEKYIHNQEDSFYRVYRFGEALIVVKAHTPALIKKISGDERDFNLLVTVSELRAGTPKLPGRLRQVLNRFMAGIPADYCCLDIVHDDMDYTIVDLNLTPYSGCQQQNRESVEFLQWGITTHLRQARPAGKCSRHPVGGRARHGRRTLSVVIAACRAGDWLEACLESVHRQQLPAGWKLEILLGVDGCDQTLRAALALKIPGLRIVALRENCGPYVTFNTLMQDASGQMICRFDADDVMMPDYLSRQLSVLAQGADMTMTWSIMTDEALKPATRWLSHLDFPVYEGRHRMESEGQFMVRRRVWDRLGGFQPWRCGADTEFYQRVRAGGFRVEVLEDCLYFRRTHADSLTAHPDTNFDSAIRREYDALTRQFWPQYLDKTRPLRVEPVLGVIAEVHDCL